MGELPKKDISMYRGDTKILRLKLVSGGAPLNIGGWTFYFTAKPDLTLPDTDSSCISVQKIVEEGSEEATSGVTELVVNTQGKQSGKYYYDIQVKTKENYIYTLLSGTLYLLDDVTRANEL